MNEIPSNLAGGYALEVGYGPKVKIRTRKKEKRSHTPLFYPRYTTDFLFTINVMFLKFAYTNVN